jgi:hypothetical protein
LMETISNVHSLAGEYLDVSTADRRPPTAVK